MQHSPGFVSLQNEKKTTATAGNVRTIAVIFVGLADCVGVSN